MNELRNLTHVLFLTYVSLMYTTVTGRPIVLGCTKIQTYYRHLHNPSL